MWTHSMLCITAALFAVTPQSNRPAEAKTYPLRNTFVVAAESVIDIASGIDLTASDAASDGQVQQLRTAKDNLAGMAEEDREKDVVTAANDLVFTVTACHLQARSGTGTDACRTQFARARTRAMEALGKHKSGPTWVDGPPLQP